MLYPGIPLEMRVVPWHSFRNEGKSSKKTSVRLGHTVPARGLPVTKIDQPKGLVVTEGYHCDHFCEQSGYKLGLRVHYKSLKEVWNN